MVATAAIVLVVTSVWFDIVSTYLLSRQVDNARAFLDGTLSEREFVRGLAGPMLVGVIGGLVIPLAALVVIIVWMHRMAKNLAALDRPGTWTQGWAVGGWFLPPFILFIIPFLMLRELWKRSARRSDVGASVSPWITIWWVLFGPMALVVIVAQGFGFGLRGSATDIASSLAEGQQSPWPSLVVRVLAAGAFVMMARQLTARHQLLIGEKGL